MTLDPRLVEHFQNENGFSLEPNLVVLATVGSHSHGTYIPPDQKDSIDDVDLMGFVVPPAKFFLGMERWEHWVWKFEELDVVIYSLDKAFRLLLKSNPNIVGTLWLKPEHYLYRHSLFDWILANRGIFASQVAGDSFAGYAHSQLTKMTSFTGDKLAKYEEYLTGLAVVGLDPTEVLQADYARLNYWCNSGGVERSFLEDFRKLHKQYFSGYMGEKRKKLVRKYGYDTKNASHLIRLLRMGVEYLETGVLQVFRTFDAEELKSIKQGAWTLGQVQDEAGFLFSRLEAARSDRWLPEEADAAAADALLVSVHREFLVL